jgi:hypothetical protein
MIDYIATEIQSNDKIKVLDLNGLIPSEDRVPPLVRLINSLQSDQL